MLKPHLTCNLVSECEGGEDEEDCGYSTCGQGGFVVNGTCYVLQGMFRNIVKTFSKARAVCNAAPHSRLACLKSKQKFENVERFFRSTLMQPLDLFIGLSSHGIPSM